MKIPNNYQFVRAKKGKKEFAGFVDTQNQRLYVFEPSGLQEYMTTEIRECFECLLDKSGFEFDLRKLFKDNSL